MEEILALQRQLQEVQETQTANKLSERVVVDLVQLVIKKYQQKLFFSQDGQEYIVPSHLDEQINEIIQDNGRINIIDLPNHIKVGLERIENRLDGIQSKYQNLIRLEDNLMTQQYLDSVAEEINEELEQRAQISLSELTVKYEFPLQFMKKVIEDRLGTIIYGNILSGDKLTTLSFQVMMKAKLRGCLRATTKPQSLSTLKNDYHIEGSILNQLIEELIQSNEIEGKIQAGQFIPTRFIKNQENIVNNFFKQNKYVEYAFLQKQLFIQKPKDFLKSSFKDKCIFLDNCCYNKDEIKSIQENIEAILQEEGHTDLSLILPSILTDSDIESLILRHMNMNSVELSETYIFSHGFIHRAVQSFREPIVQIIYNAPQKLVEEDTSKGGKKKGKKAVESKKKTSQKASIFSDEEVMTNLEKQKVINPDDRDEYTDQLFIKILQPEIQKFYDQIKIELFENKKSASSEIITELTNKVTDLMISIQYVARTVEQLEENYETINMNKFIENALFATRLLLENIVIFYCKKYCVQLPSNLFLEVEAANKPSENKSKQSPFIDCGNIRAQKIFKGKTELVTAIELIPKEYSKFLKEGMELYLKKNFTGLLKHLVDNQETIGIKAQLDKRSEKNFCFYIKYMIKEGLKKEKSDVLLSQTNFERLVTYYLLEKQHVFFIGNTNEEKFLNNQIQVLLEVSKEEETKSLFKIALEIYLSKDMQDSSKEEEAYKKLFETNQQLISQFKL